jgi:hypothetical protein
MGAKGFGKCETAGSQFRNECKVSDVGRLIEISFKMVFKHVS